VNDDTERQGRLRLNFSGRRRVPVVLQNEDAECGLACLAMVAAFHGLDADLAYWRSRFPSSGRGATLSGIMSAGGTMGLRSRPLRLEPQDMDQLKLPCLLHWDMNHFVVLTKVGRDGITIHDPAAGKRRVGFSEVDTRFTGVALELTPEATFEPRQERTNLEFSQLWRDSSGIGRALGFVLLLSLSLQAFAILAPFYMQLVIDEAVSGADHSLLSVLAFGFGLLLLIQVGSTWLRSTLLLLFSAQLSVQVAGNLLHHLLRLPMSFFERRHVGDVNSRFSSLDQIREQLTSGVIEAIVDGVMMLGTLGMMLLYAPKLTVVVLAALAIYALLRFALYSRQATYLEETIRTQAKRDSNFLETLRAMQGVKLHGRENQREVLWHNHYVDTQNAMIRSGRLSILQSGSNGLLFGLENIFVIYLGAAMVMQNALSVGMLFAFISYKSQFAQKSSGMIDKWLQFRLVRLHLDRVADIALTPRESDPELPCAMPPSEHGATLEIEGVNFRYGPTDPWILSGASARFEAGSSTVIVGPSGGGKTTLMKVLLGLLEPESGELRINGVDVRKLGFREFRRHVGAVMQDDALLAGSIADNISFFDESPDQQHIEACARIAAVHDDILRMPMGYQTLIGDMGNSLSGGQRQRVLLARALYRRPRILFLDEATSHLDVQLEALVSRGIANLKITRVLIAHRPETIRSADAALALVGGALVSIPQPGEAERPKDRLQT
jgi:ATP-binding cassette subfamily B protein RaxB